MASVAAGTTPLPSSPPTASGGATALSGFFPLSPSGGASVGGLGDSATAHGAGSLADAGITNNDTAYVSGTDSTALAGNGINNAAYVFGNDFTANATPGSNMFVIEPSLFGSATDAAATATPSDNLGPSSLLADFSWLGL